MNRLTIKDKAIRDNFNAEYAKLADLEDIEEELGIELITLFKALKNGVYYFAYQSQLTHDYVSLIDNYVIFGPVDKLYFTFKTWCENDPLLFKDYGKTWALTKEELENENKNKAN